MALVAFGAVVVQSLVTSDVWGKPPKLLVPALVILTGLAVFRDNVVNVNARLREPERQRLRVQSQKVATSAMYSVSQLRSIPMPDLGVSVFLIERTGWIRRVEMLARLIRVRLKDAPQASDILWTQGKGVIGRAWESRRPVHEATGHLAEKYGARDLSESVWSRVSKTAKQGFTRDEFITTVHKYAEILAVPIKDDQGVVLGVVSLDLAMFTKLDRSRTWLSGPEVEEIVSVAADLIAKTLKKA